METKSPVRSGRWGPSARWAWAIFSTIVWPIESYVFDPFFDLRLLNRPAHPALKRWANIGSSLRDCRGVALTPPFTLPSLPSALTFASHPAYFPEAQTLPSSAHP